MTTKTWNGSNGDFSDANRWTPGGVPAAGDVAIIAAGNVSDIFNIAIASDLIVTASSTAAGRLSMLPNVTGHVTLNNPNADGTGPTPELDVLGGSTLSGGLTVTGSNSTIAVYGALTNNGTISVIDASLDLGSAAIRADATLTNSGSINITNPDGTLGSQNVYISTRIGGQGSISIGGNVAVSFRGIESSQTLTFTGGVGTAATITATTPVLFQPTSISGFAQGDSFTMALSFTNAVYESTGATSGDLIFYDGSAATGSLHLSGVYSLASFAFVYAPYDPRGPMLTVTTRVVDPSTGAFDATSGQPIFRFFDTANGAHLYTADLGERSNILQTRPDLVEETNTFGAASATTPGAAAVYRFFDASTGTQFFTANAGERDTLIATRTDLTYEPTSTFHESTDAQGNSAVYRFFNSNNGSHFYTADATEYRGLINSAASSTYRPDLSFEGIAFYAPTGSFV